MSGNLPRSGVELVLEDRAFNAAMNRIIQGSQELDNELDALVDNAKALSDAFDSVDLELDIEVDDGALDGIEAAISALDGLSASPSIEIETTGDDPAEMLSTLETLDDTEAEAEADVEADAGDLPAIAGDLETFDGKSVEADADVEADAGDLPDVVSDLNSFDGTEVEASADVEADAGDLPAIAGDLETFDGKSVEADADVEADAGDLPDVVSDLNSFDGTEVEASADVEADAGDLPDVVSDLNSFDGTEVEASADVEADAGDLPDVVGDLNSFDGTEAEASADVETDPGDLPELATDLEALDGTVFEPELKPDVDTQGASNLKGIIGDIGVAAAAATAAVVGIGVAAGAAVAKFGAQQIIEMDGALRSIEARTGSMIPNAERLINDIYVAGFANTRQEIANVIIAADQLAIAQEDMGDALEAAFQVSLVTGQDVVTMLTLMDNMIDSGISVSFANAADVLVAGFQTGTDRSGDFFNVLGQFAPQIKDMGFTAQEFTDLLSTGLENGIANASDLTIALIDMRAKIAENNTEVMEALGALGMADLAQQYIAGQVSGAEFFSTVAAGLSSIEDQAERVDLTTSIFGRRGRRFGDAAIEALVGIGDALGEVEDRARSASDILQGTFEVTATRVFRTIEGAAVQLLSSESIDLPGKLRVLEDQLKDFVDRVQAGETIAGAFEVSFGIEGFEDSFRRFESVMGNIGIAIMQGIAGILDLINQPEAAAGLRQSIAALAEDQLAFDIRLADDGAAVQRAVETAVSRGVDAASIESAVGTAIADELAAGNVESARAILQATQEAFSSENLVVRGIEIPDDVVSQGVDAMARWLKMHGVTMLDSAMDKLSGASSERLVQDIETALATRDIDFSGLESEVAALAAALAQQVAGALAEGDLGRAAALAISSMDAGALAQVFETALAGEDLGIARAVRAEIEALGGEVGPEMDRLENQLQRRFESAIQTGDFSLAREVAQSLNDPSATATVEAWAEQLRATIISGLDLGGENLVAAEAAAAMLGDMQLYQIVRDAMSEISTHAGQVSTHLVESGDTLWDIANAYGTTVDRLMEVNGLVNNLILPGQQLLIIIDVSAPDASSAAKDLKPPQLAAEETAESFADLEIKGRRAGNQMRASMEEGSAGAREFGRNTTEQTGKARNAITAAANTVRNQLQQTHSELIKGADEWTIYADQAIEDIDRIAERLVFVSETLSGITSTLFLYTSTGGGTGYAAQQQAAAPPPPAAQHGGVFGAGEDVLVGEDGTEMITMPHEGAIVNAANTQVLMRAVDALIGGTRGDMVINNYISLQQSNHIGGRAQADHVARRTADAVRGFAS